MTDQSPDRPRPDGNPEGERGDQELSDLLGELRILLPGAQTLTAFLIILPFQSEFDAIGRAEEWSYLAMLVCSISSLVLFTAPAAYHRLVRPLRDRERFKRGATRMIVVGLVPLSLALILATHLVITRVAGTVPGFLISAVLAVLILAIWWVRRSVTAAVVGRTVSYFRQWDPLMVISDTLSHSANECRESRLVTLQALSTLIR